MSRCQRVLHDGTEPTTGYRWHTLSLSLFHTLLCTPYKLHTGLSLTYAITIPSAPRLSFNTHSCTKNISLTKKKNLCLREIYFWFWPDLCSVCEAVSGKAGLPDMTSCFLPIQGVTCSKLVCVSHPFSPIHLSAFETYKQTISWIGTDNIPDVILLFILLVTWPLLLRKCVNGECHRLLVFLPFGLEPQ